MKRYFRIALVMMILAAVLSLTGCAVRGGAIRSSIDIGDYQVKEVRNQGLYVVVDMGEGDKLVKCDSADVQVGDTVTVASDLERGEYWVHFVKKAQTSEPATPGEIPVMKPAK